MAHKKISGGFNPFKKCVSSFPQVRVKIKNIWNHHLKKIKHHPYPLLLEDFPAIFHHVIFIQLSFFPPYVIEWIIWTNHWNLRRSFVTLRKFYGGLVSFKEFFSRQLLVLFERYYRISSINSCTGIRETTKYISKMSGWRIPIDILVGYHRKFGGFSIRPPEIWRKHTKWCFGKCISGFKYGYCWVSILNCVYWWIYKNPCKQWDKLPNSTWFSRRISGCHFAPSHAAKIPRKIHSQTMAGYVYMQVCNIEKCRNIYVVHIWI